MLGSESLLIVVVQFLIVGVEEWWGEEILLAGSHFDNVRLGELPEIVLETGSHQVVTLLVFYVKLLAYNLAHKSSDLLYFSPLLWVVRFVNNVVCSRPNILPREAQHKRYYMRQNTGIFNYLLLPL